MKNHILFIVPILLLCHPCQSQEFPDSQFSLDFSYALTGILNQGWGIGLNYERRLFEHFSTKGNFGHMTFLTGINDVYNTSVSISLFMNYYPLGISNGLDKLYFGAGGGCDFMNYFGSGELPPTSKDTLIHITPLAGWKFHVLKFLIIDVSTGYKFIIADSDNYSRIKDYVNTGLRFGLDFKILLKEIKRDNRND